MILQQVSTSLLKEFRSQFSNRNFKGLFGYLAKSLHQHRDKINILARRSTASKDLQNLEFYERATEYREGRLLRSLVSRLKYSAKLDQFTAWNLNLDLVLELARAHTDRVLLTNFIEEIAAIETIPVNERNKPSNVKKIGLLPILHALCSLYSLWTIQQNMAFYLTNQYFSPVKANAIWNEINKLCLTLSVHADNLCEAFQIPQGLLNATIARDWEKEFSYPNVPGYTDNNINKQSTVPPVHMTSRL